MKNKEKEILVIVYYPENISPGQRFRIELYKEILIQNGFNLTFHTFLDKSNYNVNYRKGLILLKTWAVIKGFIKRLLLLFTVSKFGFIFIYREATPVGPALFEWVFKKIFNKKIIYDFDDAIWMPYLVTENSFFTRLLKNKGKVKMICRWSYKVSCGNKFLCEYAQQYNSNVVYNPTCVDTTSRYNMLSNHKVDRVTIGWTGSFSTLNYFEEMEPLLKRLSDKYDFDVKVICNKVPNVVLKNLKYVEWTKENELTELSTCQIGLMPLTNESWSEGKCGFKLIQYLALGIPSVASPIGVNKNIIDDGVNGFLCNSEEEWYLAIEKLLLDYRLREDMAIKGRKKIIEEYSLESNKENFLNLFQ